MLQKGQIFSFNKPGDENYVLIQIIDIYEVGNYILTYIHNFDRFEVLQTINFKGLNIPTNAELVLYKKNVCIEELSLQYQKRIWSMMDVGKRSL